MISRRDRLKAWVFWVMLMLSLGVMGHLDMKDEIALAKMMRKKQEETCREAQNMPRRTKMTEDVNPALPDSQVTRAICTWEVMENGYLDDYTKQLNTGCETHFFDGGIQGPITEPELFRFCPYCGREIGVRGESP